MARLSNVEVNRTGIEAHSSLCLGKRYQEPPRSTYLKIVIAQPTTDKHLALSLAVKAMSEALGPEGLLPSALVFGEFAPFCTRSEVRKERPTSAQPAEVAAIARTEMGKNWPNSELNEHLTMQLLLLPNGHMNLGIKYWSGGRRSLPIGLESGLDGMNFAGLTMTRN